MNTKTEARSAAKTVQVEPATDARTAKESMVVPTARESAPREEVVFDEDDFYANAPCTD